MDEPNATCMILANRLYVLLCTVILTGPLPGCAVYSKCGFGGCPGDAKITAEVRALFARYPALEPPNLIHVQTLDHVVYLYGLVDTGFQLRIAEAVAIEAPGATRVVNAIGLSGNR
jgi:osmotically-inducible protein OsmY